MAIRDGAWPHRVLASSACTLALTAAACTGGAARPSDPAGGTGRVTARAPGSDVGPLFRAGLTGLHVCTASVVHTPGGDVIATAAHCVSGTGAGIVFAPGYDGGVAPFGTWTVTASYVDPAWADRQDPHDDVAFLTVAPSPGDPLSRAPVEQVVGAATVSVAPATGTRVTATGYALGSGDSALTCSAATTTTDGYPTLPCGPLPAGTSGAPWTATTAGGRAALVGVSGGLHQGGCTADISYSSPFTAATTAVLARAAAGGTSDVLPNALGDDGC